MLVTLITFYTSQICPSPARKKAASTPYGKHAALNNGRRKSFRPALFSLCQRHHLALHRDRRIPRVGHYDYVVHPLLTRHPLPTHFRSGADILDGILGPLVGRRALPLNRTYNRIELGGADRLDQRRRRLRVLRPLESVQPDLVQGIAETERLRPLLLSDLFVLVANL